MRKVRVLVVDDVAIIRRLVVDALSTDPDLEVVGTAQNGRDALAQIPVLKPDLLVLDYEMPEMDGLETLIEVRKSHSGVRVIIFSSHTRQGAKETLDALWFGADDYVTKARADSLSAATECVRQDLIPKIKAICLGSIAAEGNAAADPAASATTMSPGQSPPRQDATRARSVASRVEIVAIGASTGGPKALATLIEDLPADFAVPIVVVQHMPPIFTRYLAERLATCTSLRCAEGIAGTVLEPGMVWIAPGDFHMVVRREGSEVRLELTTDAPENGCRPAVDPLFRSVAAAYGPGALGVVLTGMGQDGLAGSREIHQSMGQVLVQDEATSVVWGMPGAIHRAGMADRVLPLAEIAGEIRHRVSAGIRRRSPVG
jgi:two-component system chemotaxis response regulator CheB